MSNAPNPLESLVLPETLQKITFYKDENNVNCVYFKIEKEDHTLGNLIHSKLLKENHVLFSGYKRTHPLDHFIFFKIITDGFISPVEAFDSVLKDLYIELSYIEDFFNTLNT
jgi:DNA-directed RNA polymerase II subunit RPB11